MDSTLQILKSIWKRDICADYERGVLPNERTLQAAIYHYLRQVRTPRLDVFVEITSFLGSKRDIPDLIITRDRRIEAVVELKFIPKTGIVYERDSRKLTKWSRLVAGRTKSKKVDTLELNPKTMEWKDKRTEKNRYTLGPFTAWVFAAIGTDCDAFEPEKINSYLRSQKCGQTTPKNFWLLRGMVSSKEGKASKFDCRSLAGGPG